MRIPLAIAWCLIPFGAWAYHEGPGQEHLRRDEVADLVSRGHEAAAKEQWITAVRRFEDALKELPKDDVSEARWLRLELDKAKMMASKLPEARGDLEELLGELTDAEAEVAGSVDPKLLAGTREALANANYYFTWLMRLEGRPREDWEPIVESARQGYRLLAEASIDTAERERLEKDLESTVRLARMEIGELQGLPLPSQ